MMSAGTLIPMLTHGSRTNAYATVIRARQVPTNMTGFAPTDCTQGWQAFTTDCVHVIDMAEHKQQELGSAQNLKPRWFIGRLGQTCHFHMRLGLTGLTPRCSGARPRDTSQAYCLFSVAFVTQALLRSAED